MEKKVELIDKTELVLQINSCQEVTRERVLAIINGLAVHGVEKSKTAHWVDDLYDGSDLVYCSRCNTCNDIESPYCPYCGAYMKGEHHE